MPYQGNTPAENYVVTVKDSFSGNGAATAFTLSQPTVTNDVRVVVENVVQDPTVAYAVSGTTLTFTSAPVSGTNNIYVIHLGPAVQQVAPPSTISNATTFESNVSVQGLFNSVGIDDNADATAITIDSSEVVLVGKTSNTFSQQGVALRANNDSQITRDGGHPLSLNRTSSDGAILNLYKAGDPVGSISTWSSNIAVGRLNCALLFDDDTNRIKPASVQSNTTRDNVIDLGDPSHRFNDVWIGGGIHLGGTGSDNKLNDYEKGTYDITITGATSGSETMRSGYAAQSYVKIGDLVTVTGRYEVSGGNASGNLQFSLPFAIAGSLDDQSDTAVGSISFFRNATWFSSTLVQAIGYPGTSVMFAAYTTGTANESFVTGENCDGGYEGYINFQYRTA